jgi:hypothetical protein
LIAGLSLRGAQVFESYYGVCLEKRGAVTGMEYTKGQMALRCEFALAAIRALEMGIGRDDLLAGLVIILRSDPSVLPLMAQTTQSDLAEYRRGDA